MKNSFNSRMSECAMTGQTFLREFCQKNGLSILYICIISFSALYLNFFVSVVASVLHLVKYTNTVIIHRAIPITQVDYVKINGHINLGLLTQHQPFVLTSDHSRTVDN